MPKRKRNIQYKKRSHIPWPMTLAILEEFRRLSNGLRVEDLQEELNQFLSKENHLDFNRTWMLTLKPPHRQTKFTGHIGAEVAFAIQKWIQSKTQTSKTKIK